MYIVAVDDTLGMLKKIVVFGGNGYVGQNVCQCAVELGISVMSISRSGSPFQNKKSPDWGKNVQWETGDAENESSFLGKLKGVDGVVSCIGAFGSNSFMEKVNGDLNIAITKAAAESGVLHLREK